jgi:hypothetical protein
MAISYYKKEFPTKATFAKSHKLAFNLEKETKFTNPHKIEQGTTNQQFYKGEIGQKA